MSTMRRVEGDGERGELSGAEGVRVVVVDDRPLFRERAALESARDGRVVAETGTTAAALEVVSAQRPGMVLMDLSLPDISGTEATKRSAQLHPGLPVLVLTTSDDGSLLGALQAGARLLRLPQNGPFPSHREQLKALDDRYKAATVEDDGYALGEFQKLPGPDLWWWRRHPRVLTGELGRSLRSAGAVGVDPEVV